MHVLQLIALWLGAATMVVGGLGVFAVVAWWALERVAKRWTDAVALVRIMRYAQRNGLNLATGEKATPETPA